jgi:hypothetical protein
MDGVRVGGVDLNINYNLSILKSLCLLLSPPPVSIVLNEAKWKLSWSAGPLTTRS